MKQVNERFLISVVRTICVEDHEKVLHLEEDQSLKWTSGLRQV